MCLWEMYMPGIKSKFLDINILAFRPILKLAAAS